MVVQVPPFWNIAGDGFQILFCLLILFFFVKNRSIQKKCIDNQPKNDAGQSFNAHIFNITVQHQVNRAFTNIMGTITAERDGLEQALGLNPLSNEEDVFSKVKSNSQRPPDHDSYRLSDEQTEGARRHETIRKFAAKGLNARKISEALKIPMSEVELVLSLQKK